MTVAGPSRFVFPSRQGKPLDPHGVAHAMRRVLPDLGLDENPATPHDLRRTVASQLAAMGIPESIIARVLNHTSEIGRTITGRSYIRHAFAAEKRHALESWSSRLADIIDCGERGNVVRRLQH
jgi:integrase